MVGLTLLAGDVVENMRHQKKYIDVESEMKPSHWLSIRFLVGTKMKLDIFCTGKFWMLTNLMITRKDFYSLVIFFFIHDDETPTIDGLPTLKKVDAKAINGFIVTVEWWNLTCN